MVITKPQASQKHPLPLPRSHSGVASKNTASDVGMKKEAQMTVVLTIPIVLVGRDDLPCSGLQSYINRFSDEVYEEMIPNVHVQDKSFY